jgi:O-antigen biosynthesis protein WbqP
MLVASSPNARQAAMRGRFAKRAFDAVVGLILCVLITPVVLTLMVILAIQHRSPRVVFIHQRVGYRTRLITVPKLRTLHLETHPYADKTLVDLVPVSRFANFLRRSHLDELPQLYLVPIGRLSLVGPRPRMQEEAALDVDPRFRLVRTAVPLGCTGLWQVGAHTGGRVSDAPEYDYFYVRHRTLRMDLWIMWRTVAQLYGAKGVSLDRVPRWLMAPAEAEVEEHSEWAHHAFESR